MKNEKEKVLFKIKEILEKEIKAGKGLFDFKGPLEKAGFYVTFSTEILPMLIVDFKSLKIAICNLKYVEGPEIEIGHIYGAGQI